MEQNAQPVFGIEKLYVKDLSIEVPNAPEIFLEREQPQVEIQLNTGGRAVGEGVYEVVLTVTVTAKISDKTVFLVEVGQAGIFRIQNVPEEQLEPLIAVACPNILFPYAREAVSDAVSRAGNLGVHRVRYLALGHPSKVGPNVRNLRQTQKRSRKVGSDFG